MKTIRANAAGAAAGSVDAACGQQPRGEEEQSPPGGAKATAKQGLKANEDGEKEVDLSEEELVELERLFQETSGSEEEIDAAAQEAQDVGNINSLTEMLDELPAYGLA